MRSIRTVAVESKTYCAKHPKEETAVSCASCGTPICPRCMVSTPVGMKCRDCGTGRKSSLYQIRPERFLLAALAALVAGAATMLLGRIGFFVIFVATAYGYFAGTVILRASGMKRGVKLEVVAGVGMVVGGLAAMILSGGVGSLLSPFFWIALVIATSCAVSKIRYL